MKITKVSPLSGKVHTMDLDITFDQLQRYYRGDSYVQDLFPHLTPGEREFLMTGITDEEWDANIGND